MEREEEKGSKGVERGEGKWWRGKRRGSCAIREMRGKIEKEI